MPGQWPIHMSQNPRFSFSEGCNWEAKLDDLDLNMVLNGIRLLGRYRSPLAKSTQQRDKWTGSDSKHFAEIQGTPVQQVDDGQPDGGRPETGIQER